MSAVVEFPRDPDADASKGPSVRSPLDRLRWLTDFVIPSGVTGATVKVAGSIARHVNSENGRCDPSSGTITQWSGVTNPRRAIRELRERGLIRVFEREGKSNGYALLFAADQPLGRVTIVQGVDGGGQIGHTTLDNCDTPPRTNRSPKQGKEQGKEQETLYSDGDPSPSHDPRKGRPKPEAKRRRKPETPFPDDFALTDELRAHAKLGVDVDEDFARFRDHALTHDRRCRDWKAAWRNWCRSDIPKPMKAQGASSLARPRLTEEQRRVLEDRL